MFFLTQGKLLAVCPSKNLKVSYKLPTYNDTEEAFLLQKGGMEAWKGGME
jgi:hypothetical protein